MGPSLAFPQGELIIQQPWSIFPVPFPPSEQMLTKLQQQQQHSPRGREVSSQSKGVEIS